MAKTIEEALAEATFYSDDQLYIFVKLPARAITAAASVIAEISDPFIGLIADKDEVSLIIPKAALEDFAARLPGHVSSSDYRLITFDVELDLSLVGFMAQVSKALAAANIPIMPLAAYTRDHLLIPAEQFETAMQTLNSLKSSVK